MSEAPDNKPSFPSWAEVLGINLRKLALFLCLGLVVIAILWYGNGRYAKWKTGRLEILGREYLAKGDLMSATVTAREVLRLKPNSLPALLVMAETSERIKPAAAAIWWHQVAILFPEQTNAFLAWASAGIRDKNWLAADQALSSAPSGMRNTVKFQELAGLLALGSRQFSRAEEHFNKARILNPENPINLYYLAALQMNSSRADKAHEGWQLMESLTNNTLLRLNALRALHEKARLSMDITNAVQYASRIGALTNLEFSDQLKIMDTFRKANLPQAELLLNNLQTSTVNQPAQAGHLLLWMNGQGLASNAVAWAATLNSNSLTLPAITAALAECYASLRDWEALLQLIDNADWQELGFLRSAYQARVWRERENTHQYAAAWNRALRECQGDVQMLSMLANLARSWGWDTAVEAIWWQIARNPLGTLSALESLFQYYASKHDGKSLFKVAAQVYALNPAEPVARNNFASLALLLNREATNAHQIARENHLRFPKDLNLMTTFAFSLCRQGTADEALRLLREHQPALEQQPALSAYYGLVLAATGDTTNAAPWLRRALASANLLLEERELIEETLAGKGMAAPIKKTAATP